MSTFINVLVVLIATFFGAIAGLGGGVIIKPMFDLVGSYNASTIGFYSSMAVFSMCIISIYKQVKNKFSFDKKVILSISLGSLIGGVLGEYLFSMATQSLTNEQIKFVQACLLGITLLLIFIYTINKDKIKSFNIKNTLSIVIIGIMLGSISVFLGIGGGPLNVATLVFLFSFSMKEATVYSIATIFFAQLSKLSTIVISGQLSSFDLSPVPLFCLTAILGGYLGTRVSQKLSNKKIESIYLGLIIFLMVLSCYNMWVNI